MGLPRAATFLPCVAASLAAAQTIVVAPDAPASAPVYTPQQCDDWVGLLVSSDDDASGGLSGAEYYAFLSSIADPPYISRYFQQYNTFERLPWAFRVVKKSLACHCEQLGLGAGCCEGDGAEVPLLGLAESNTTAVVDSPDDDYKDLFCQQIAFVLTRAIPSPAPTAGPSDSPSVKWSPSPLQAPSQAPAALTLTAPTLTASPASAQPNMAPTSPQSTATPSKQEVVPELRTPEEDDENEERGLGPWAIFGIVVGAVAVVLCIVATVAYNRRERKAVEDPSPEADLMDTGTSRRVSRGGVAMETGILTMALEQEREKEGDDDRDSAAPSVWSESEAEDAAAELHDPHDAPAATAGSALAAMGAASTVAARMSAGAGHGGEDGSPNPGETNHEDLVSLEIGVTARELPGANGANGADNVPRGVALLAAAGDRKKVSADEGEPEAVKKSDRRIGFTTSTKESERQRGTVYHDAKTSPGSVDQDTPSGDPGAENAGNAADGGARRPSLSTHSESGHSLFYDAQSQSSGRSLYYDAESGRSLASSASGRSIYYDAESGQSGVV